MAKRNTADADPNQPHPGRAELPEPSLDHLKRLTDDTGLFQHAKFTIPLRQEGYTTDDNARALIVATKYYALYKDPEALRLLDTYLSFVLHAHQSDGTVKNFMLFDRTWQKSEPMHDALGRVLWSLGTLLAQLPSSIHEQVVRERFDISAPLIEKQQPRSMAYSMLGLHGYLRRVPDAEHIRSCMKTAADILVQEFESNSRPDWPWFHDALGDHQYLKVAKETCDFLLANTFTGTHFSFIGCQGWYKQGASKAQFDQQPIDTTGTVLMLKAAHQATGDNNYLKMQRKAFAWFLGENDIGVPLYDAVSKGCGDGLGAGGVSANQGAESTVSFLLALLAMLENK